MSHQNCYGYKNCEIYKKNNYSKYYYCFRTKSYNYAFRFNRFAGLWLAIFADVGVGLLAVLNSLRTLNYNIDV